MVNIELSPQVQGAPTNVNGQNTAQHTNTL